MAVADRELSIVLRVVNGELMNGISQAEGAIKNFAANSVSSLDQVEERTENLRHVWKGLFEAFIGVEVVNVLKGIAEAANDAAEKLDIAARTAKNFGNSLDPEQMEKWLQQFAASAQGGGFALPDMRQGVQTFSAIGLDSDQTKRALADSANLAAAYGFDLPQAISITQKALTGHVELLTRYGIITREAAKNIHTVEDAMRALEHASAGAAEERANGLAGAFGRLGNAVNRLTVAFGSQLIPYFDATANALVKMTNAFTALPTWVQQAAAGIAFFSLGLTALGLLLPAVKLSVEFLIGGFGLLRAVLGTLVGGFGGVTIAAAAQSDVMAALAAKEITAAEAQELLQASSVRATGALGLLRTLIVGPLMGAFSGFVSILRSVITALAVDLVGADAAAAAGFAGIAAPILAVIALLAGVVSAIAELSGHWAEFTNFLSTAWHEFTNNFLHDGKAIADYLQGLSEAIQGNFVGGVKDMLGALSEAMPKTTLSLAISASEAVAGIQSAVKGAWNNIVNFFKGGIGTIAIPKPRFTGVVPGKTGTKDTTSKAAENALKNFDEATKNWLDQFSARVNAAQAMVDASKAKLDTYTASLPNGKPQTAQEEAKYEHLLNDELKAQANLRQATLEKHQAEVAAAAKYEEIAKSISTHLKNHDQLVRQALDAARSHNDEATKLWTTYQNLGVTLAQIKSQMRDIRDTTAEATGELDIQKARNVLDARLNANAGQVETVEHARNVATEQHGGTLPKIQDDNFAVQLAQLALAAAQAKEAFAADTVAIANHTAKVTGTLADQQKAIDAQNQLTQAHLGTIAAENRLGEVTDKLVKDLQKHQTALGTALDELVKRLNVPGLTPNAQTGGFSFSPMQFLLQAFEQTKAFADIMKTVNQIVSVFAQLLDNLRPIIDIVLTVIRSVANVFIFLYDTVARILRLLGIHLQLINSLNDAYGNIPLIEITHNIPTLNELAAGKLNNPLSNTPIGESSLENIGNTHTSLLQSILGTLVAILAAEMLFGHGHNPLSGILGSLGHLFGMGGASASGAPAPTLSDAYGALQTLPSDSVAQGTQTALAADGSSMSGGLFQATNNALKSASPYLASAIGAVLGSATGGGGTASTLLGGIGSIVGTIFGGPVGGAIGGFLGGILGGLFGHHKSAPAPTQQTTEFTAMLHQATDVHAWMNGLTTQAISTLQVVGNTANALTQAAQSISKAATSVASASFANTNNFGGVHLHNDLDLDRFSRTLSEASQRQNRSFQFSLERVPIG